jgi:hypothetical protein
MSAESHPAILSILFWLSSRVARWFVFKPKIPIWEKFQGLRLENVALFYGHLEYYMDIWDIL